jgi:predicted TIM-barrel fold metal-dependent hydrolase
VAETFPLFDSHFHIIDPRFPLVPNQGYVPESFTCADYLSWMSRYDLRGGAIVSGSFQGVDQSYLISALATLGEGYVGVTQLPLSVADEQIAELHERGVRALRFNLRRGGSEQIEYMKSMAQRVYDIAGWHVELYIDSRELSELKGLLLKLPLVCIDHLGLSREGVPVLMSLVEQGARVKASGFGRVELDIAQALRDLYQANPQALMLGSDLPGTRAPRTFQHSDYTLVRDVLGDTAANDVYYLNAQALYFAGQPVAGAPVTPASSEDVA